MKKIQTWKNQTFCFKLSVIAILLWLVTSSTISIIIYSLEHQAPYRISIFVLPAIILFGLINAVPFILNWLSKPKIIENNHVENKKHDLHHTHKGHNKPRKNATSKNKANSSHKMITASYNNVATKLEHKVMGPANSSKG